MLCFLPTAQVIGLDLWLTTILLHVYLAQPIAAATGLALHVERAAVIPDLLELLVMPVRQDT